MSTLKLVGEPTTLTFPFRLRIVSTMRVVDLVAHRTKHVFPSTTDANVAGSLAFLNTAVLVATACRTLLVDRDWTTTDVPLLLTMYFMPSKVSSVDETIELEGTSLMKLTTREPDRRLIDPLSETKALTKR
jgi:hypothetical protein